MTTLQKLTIAAVLAWTVFFAAVTYADHTFSITCQEMADLSCSAYCSGTDQMVFGANCPYPGNVTYGDHVNMFNLNNAQCVATHTCEPPPDPTLAPCIRDRRVDIQEGVIYTNNTTQPFEFKLLMNPVTLPDGTVKTNTTIDLSDGNDWVRRSHEDCPGACNDTGTVIVHPGYSFIFFIHVEQGVPAGAVEHSYICGLVDETEEFTL